jgi:hypothetical protein
MMRHSLSGTIALLVVLCAWPAWSQTYRQTWTTTSDFEGGELINVDARQTRDQLQLDLRAIETPYLWVANSQSDNVARIDTATGRVLSISQLPEGTDPSRTAVDLNFDCWVAARSVEDGRAFKLSAEDGAELGRTPRVGSESRGVAVNYEGQVWVSSSGDVGRGYGWMKIDPETFQPTIDFQGNLPSYGLAISAFGKLFSTTSWRGFSSVYRLDGVRGRMEQRWRLRDAQDQPLDGDVYGIAVDLDGDLWGTVYPNAAQVVWIQGDYQCPNGEFDCTIQPGRGLRQIIDVEPVIRAAGGRGNFVGRGLAVDVNGFVWAVFQSTGDNGGVEQNASYVVKIDGSTGQPINATEVGRAAVGITPDANGFLWVVNFSGGGANYQNFSCPNGFDPQQGGTVSRIRSSDGSVVATYPTCGVNPYTYSDMAGYALRSITLRSGNWSAIHDSGRPGLEWGRVDWNSQDFDDTTLRIQVRAADSREALAEQPFREVSNGDALPLQGRYIEVDGFFFTRNDFLGPVLYDLTVSSVCIPTAEVCDGFDNDCDGVVDNGNPGGGQDCQTSLEGICNQGMRFCNRGEYECRPVQEPVAETCDGVDNNCNGTIDEGVTNLCGECGPAPVEVCDGIDNDCDSVIDEGVQNACGQCGEVPVEVCDGIDNDCDGLTDEELLNACGECGEVPVEVCDGEDNDCDGLVDEDVANACGECGPEPVEICDGVDNDCDGAIDEGLINACGQCGPDPIEVCDGVDNDCDGETDEGVLNECGFCGRLPEEVCDGVDNDCDGEVDEGLTNACGGCGPVPTETCNGIDDDCDGETDEGVTNACGGCGLPPSEVCDGVDNDCDGEVDEGVTNRCGGCGSLGEDVCDGEDNDCDGEIDEDAGCEGQQACVSGECAEPCAAGECPRGFLCRDSYCVTDPCVGLQCSQGQLCRDGVCLPANEVQCQDVQCAGGQVCIGGACQDDPCPQVECPQGQTCWLGDCLEDDVVACLEQSCGQGEVCQDGACVPDPCAQVRCEDGLTCVNGVCEDACLTMTCSTGFVCREGVCVEDACTNVQCPASQVCQDGNCVYPGCIDVTCEDGEQCGAEGCAPVGACGDEVCGPDEVCQGGACVDINGAPADTTPSDSGDEGCGCSSLSSGRAGQPGQAGLLLAALGLALAWTRRRGPRQ